MMTTYAIGVDLGGTNLRIAAIDGSGKTLEKITTSTEVARGRDLVIDEMCTAILANCDQTARHRRAGRDWHRRAGNY